MKHTSPDVLLTRELLCFVRDHSPTIDAFCARFGGAGGQCFHALRKAQLLVIEDERVRLSERHLTPDGRLFIVGCRVIHLDEDRIDLVRWGRS